MTYPEAWRKLCATAGIYPIPESLEERREVCGILGVHLGGGAGINAIDRECNLENAHQPRGYT